MSMTGKIKWYNSAKGFGFITPDDGGKDVFIHVSALKESNIKEVTDNQPVTYELVEFRGREVASNITITEISGNK
jgi:CspA family cold shock protein